MHALNGVSLHNQRGVSLTGLIVFLIVAMFVAMLALKVVPSIIEYNAIKAAIAAAKTSETTVGGARNTFDKNAEINDIKTITGKDLMIEKTGEGIDISFAYRKELPLFENVALVIDYAGTTNPSGVVPEKATEAPK